MTELDGFTFPESERGSNSREDNRACKPFSYTTSIRDLGKVSASTKSDLIIRPDHEI